MTNEARPILENIIADFAPEKFSRFFREKSRQFAARQEDLAYYNDDSFTAGQKLGEIKFPDGNELLVCTFAVQQPLSERSGKKAQYEKAKKILKDRQRYSAGIFIFSDASGNFRFSLVYPESTGAKRQWNNFRRFTYFVSADPAVTNKTYLQRIGDGDFSTLQKIKEAFSVEKVTKEFYEAIANWYFWALDHSHFAKDAEAEDNGRNISVIRLITRIIFIWFMRERGLVPKALFDEKSIPAILKDISPNESTYYKAILQNLFFATLSTKKAERQLRSETRGYKGYNPDFGNQYVYRYHEYFRQPDKIKDYFAEIPFLNGGLFECLDDKANDIYIDGFTATKKNQPEIPNLLFFSAEQMANLNKHFGTKDKKYKVSGLFDILSSFNFTIDENTADDQDVALDPELLGRVFENLLASFNPETATTARKATGSYYTPRQIVDYMVQESLRAYFKTHLSGIADTDIKLEQLFSAGSAENPFNGEESKTIVNLIESVKIVDPTVGSGAFPMGALNKLVFILNKVDAGNELWKQAQLAVVEAMPDSSLRRETRNRIEEFFKGKNADYGRKLYLIQRCIYGVDIQQIAVEIAKLRFFISLLVDEKIDKTKDNWGIEPLPNLDFKIMQGNSLISSFMGIDFDNGEEKQEGQTQAGLAFINEDDALIKAFEQKKIDFQSESAADKKAKLKKEIEDLLIKIFEAKIKKQKAEYFKEMAAIERRNSVLPNKQTREETIAKEKQKISQKMNFDLEGIEKQLREFTSKKKTRPFFPWKLYFAEVFEKGGFDVVIGNPPYFNISTINKDFVKYLSERYKVIHTGYNDIVYYFIYLGVELLNKTGCSVLITSNYYLGNEYAKKLRSYLGQHISKVINFRDHMVFESASVHTCISVSYKEPKFKDVIFFESTGDVQITSINIEEALSPCLIKRESLKNNWVIADKSNNEILEKIKKNAVLLGNIAIIKKGATSGDREIFTISKLFAEKNGFEKELLKTSINSKDIKRYVLVDSGDYLIYNDNSIKIENYPNICKYLLKHQEKLNKRNEVLKGLYPWYRLERPREKEVFDAKEKLVVPYRAENNMFAYDNSQGFNDGGGSYALVMKKGERILLKYLLGILNSKLMDWFYGFIGKPKGKVREYFNGPLSLIPIKNIAPTEQQPIVALVDQILVDHDSPDVSKLEAEIDKLVYELYGLTEDEIAIVEER